MQEYLASEWSTRFKAVEKEFEDGISKFEELKNRLTLSHQQLDARERFMKAEEARVSIILVMNFLMFIKSSSCGGDRFKSTHSCSVI